MGKEDHIEETIEKRFGRYTTLSGGKM